MQEEFRGIGIYGVVVTVVTVDTTRSPVLQGESEKHKWERRA